MDGRLFGNDPEMVAELFFKHLGPKGAFWGRFKYVLFSVLDNEKELNIYKAFEKRIPTSPCETMKN